MTAPSQPPVTASQAPSRPAPGARLRLSPAIGLRLFYRDETPFGSPVSERCEREMHKRFAVLHGFRRRYGLARLVREAPQILQRVMPDCLKDIRTGPQRLADAWLYPPRDQVRPAFLRVERELSEAVALIELEPALVGELADWLGDWQLGAAAPGFGPARALWDALIAAGALVEQAAETTPLDAGLHFVGHACVALSDGHRRLLVDPFLLPPSTRYPADRQPPSLETLGRPDAVFITHSHPDHYDLGTLLRCGSETPIHVPAVARESVLAIDMGARLRELGFRRVIEVEDWRDYAVGDLAVTAMPFHGEQPTTAEVMHPEVRNHGATYLLRSGGRRHAVLADAGRDGAGDIRQVAGEARRRYGPIDAVFGGYRGFALYPVQYAFSSVSRYLPFVPEAAWGERQQIMCDADDLLDVAERWQARRVVPYAAGGAPWFWLRGLGPCLDGSMDRPVSADPPPEYLVEVAARRSATGADGAIASPVEVLPLRVGERLPA